MAKPKIRIKGFEEEWDNIKLLDITISISSGKDTPSKGSFPLYGSTGIIGTVESASYEGPLLLIARVGANAGYLQLVNEKCGVTDNTLVIRSKANISLDYLFFFFQHYKLKKFVYGSGQPLITGGMLKEVGVYMGSVSEIQTIVSYFQLLNFLIQITIKKIASLKQMKQACLVSMFPQIGETTPRIRFKGFEGEWDRDKAGNIYMTFNERNRPDLPVLSANQDIRGMAPRTDTGYNISHNKANEVTYKVVKPGQYVIHLRSFQGGFAHSAVEGITSPAYTVFGFKDANRHDDYFWKIIFMSKGFIKSLETITYGIRDGRSINFSEFSEMNFLFPSKEEQQRIASFFRSLDTQISLQEQRLEKLKQIKSACLDKMFV